MKTRTAKPASMEPAIEGRVKIAQALSGIMGVPVSVHQLDRLEARKYHPLPIHGKGRKWAFRAELQEWWAEEDGQQEEMRA